MFNAFEVIVLGLIAFAVSAAVCYEVRSWFEGQP